MRSVYLISGSYKKEGFPSDAMQELKQELNNEENFCFIPTKFSEIDKNKERCKKIISWFKKEHITFKEVFIIDDSIPIKECRKRIKKSKVIFLTGGDTLKQIEGINKKYIKRALKEDNKILIGMSAGAINMAKKVIVAKDVSDNIPETKKYPGIGVTNINIEPHCDFNNKEHWKDLLEASKNNKIYCMCDNCSIIERGKERKIYGNYCIIENNIIISDNREL